MNEDKYAIVYNGVVVTCILVLQGSEVELIDVNEIPVKITEETGNADCGDLWDGSVFSKNTDSDPLQEYREYRGSLEATGFNLE